MKSLLIAVLLSATLSLAALLTACGPAKPALPPARSVVTVSLQDAKRSYILRIPKSYDGHRLVPLVMLLHGAGDSAAYAEQAYHFDEKADAEGFILVLPDADADLHAWDAFGTSTGKKNDDGTPRAESNDDVLFLTTILDSLLKTYAIDKKRVFIAGHSSGAMMTYRMIAQHPEYFGAAGIVAGEVSDADNHSIPNPKAAMPLIIFHGLKDENVPYGDRLPGRTGNVVRAVALWSRINQCTTVSEHAPAWRPNVARDAYLSRLPSQPSIEIYTLLQGNHMWPGGKVMPGKDLKPVQDLSATDFMWTFFQQHPKPN